MMDFSIITPVYNGEAFISQTVESVLSNFDPNLKFEYLIIDDGSIDNTKTILEQYSENKLVKVFSVKNSGEAAAVNYGLEKAKGDYILIVNADDPLLSPRIFTLANEIFKSNEKVVVVYPDWKIVSESNLVLETKKLSRYSFEVMVGEFQCLPGPGSMFRRSTALKVGGRSTLYRFVSDYDFWLKLSLQGDFFHIPEVLAQWRSHSESTSVTSKGYEMGMERIKVIEEFVNYADIKKSLKRKALSHAYYHGALLSYFSREVPGRKWMLKAFLIQRGWIKNADIRIVVFCLLYPFSWYLLPLINRTPFINNPIKDRRD
jgi:glycosyltransferase involved in cell wall biosynthesis